MAHARAARGKGRAKCARLENVNPVGIAAGKVVKETAQAKAVARATLGARAAAAAKVGGASCGASHCAASCVMPRPQKNIQPHNPRGCVILGLKGTVEAVPC